MEEKERWLSLADMFAMQGDIKGMRAAAAKILEDSPGDLDALSVVAEATFYLGEYEAASRLIRQIRVREPEHLRALLVVAAGYAVDFVLDKEVESLQHILQLADRSGQPTAFVRRTVQKAQGWLMCSSCWDVLPRRWRRCLQRAGSRIRWRSGRGFSARGFFCRIMRCSLPV